MDKNSILANLQATIADARNLQTEIIVIIVANVKSKNHLKEYESHSLQTEFFAENEYEEIITAFRDNGFYVQFHQDENSFFKWFLEGGLKKISKKFACVYGAASGGKGPGRKALVPAFCNLNGLPITSSNAYVVSLCRHKYHFSQLLHNHGLAVPATWLYSKHYGWLLDRKPPIGTQVLAKPSYESASIGIDKSSMFAYENDMLLDKISESFDQPITVQEFINGYEVEVPVIVKNGEIMTIEPIGLSLEGSKLLGNNFLTYDIVYKDEYNFYQFKELGEKVNQNLLTAATNASRTIGIEGFGRVDFRVNTKGEYFIMDVSTYPHIIRHSSFWYMFRENGFNYQDIFGLLVGLVGQRNNWY
jgi:D-alanine-D-alanine ligase